MNRRDSKTTAVALIGCGAVAELYHAPALQELAQQKLVQVKTLFDPSPARRAILQRIFPEAVAVADFAEAMQSNVELAIVASPPRYHAQQTVALLQQGIAVFCEKPMAMSVAEGERMVQAARENQRQLAIGLYRRFLPAAQFIHEFLSNQRLGLVTSFACCEGGIFRWPTQSATFFENVQGRGGILMDIGVHLLDLLIWWWGEPVQISYEDDAMGGVEANCRIKLTFAGGFSGSVRLSRDCDIANSYTIQCAQGKLVWNVHEANRVLLTHQDASYQIDGRIHPITPSSPSSAPTIEQTFTSQFRNVLAALRGEVDLMVPGHEALRSLRAIESCYQCGTLISMPWLSDIELAQARLLSNRLAL